MAWVGLSRVYSGLDDPAAAGQALAQAQALSATASAREGRRVAVRAKQLEAMADVWNPARHLEYKQAIDAALAADPADVELWLIRGNAEEPTAAGRGQRGTAASVGFLHPRAPAGTGPRGRPSLPGALLRDDRPHPRGPRTWGGVRAPGARRGPRPSHVGPRPQARGAHRRGDRRLPADRRAREGLLRRRAASRRSSTGTMSTTSTCWPRRTSTRGRWRARRPSCARRRRCRRRSIAWSSIRSC